MIRGITKVRNEAHILNDCLDSWGRVCDAIHVYCDDCTDHGSTSMIAKEHPAVVEVIESNLFDPDRERAEWWNRQAVLRSALRFLDTSPESEDWIVYFDGDEILEHFDKSVLDATHLDMVACRSHDVYITPEDDGLTEWDYKKRQWVGREWQFQPYFYSCRLDEKLVFNRPDQRIFDLPRTSKMRVSGLVRHYGKGLSLRKYAEKCDYYTKVFGDKYKAKWEKRKGNGVKMDMRSDFGFPLATWDDVVEGKVDTPCWNFPRPMKPIR